MSSATIKDGVGANLSLAVEPDADGNLSPRSTPLVGGNPVSASNPVPVTSRSGIPLTQSLVTATTSSGLLIAANAARRYLAVFNNDSTTSVTISLANPAVVGSGLQVPAGGGIVFDAQAIPTNAVWCIASGSALLVVWEG